MRLLTLATALAVALLAGATAASALEVGANDDSAKHSDDRGETMFTEMAALGLRQVVVGVRFTPSQPDVIPERRLLEQVVPKALDAGLRVVFAVFPYPTREIEAGLGSPDQFGAWAREVARAFPQVRRFVVGNEPNQPAFWRPQFDAGGKNASAGSFGPYLAAAYDALKAVDPGTTVIGVGLSPRGNDKPNANGNISTSPVRFLRALGAWYRASGRTRPLMDGFSFHPYPAKATDPLDRGYGWPNAGFVNLDRIKQALWDAFQGTAQPTTLSGLKLHLDEVGWQVDTAGQGAYQGSENVPVTDEETQAKIYAELVRRAACDPDVAGISFFGFRDDGLRTGFQAGLQTADGVPRPATDAVREAITETARGCPKPLQPWQPETTVVGVKATVLAGKSRVSARVVAGEDARGSVCVREAAAAKSGRCVPVTLRGMRPLTVSLVPPVTKSPRVEVKVDLAAEANPTRRTTVVKRAALGP